MIPERLAPSRRSTLLLSVAPTLSHSPLHRAAHCSFPVYSSSSVDRPRAGQGRDHGRGVWGGERWSISTRLLRGTYIRAPHTPMHCGCHAEPAVGHECRLSPSQLTHMAHAPQSPLCTHAPEAPATRLSSCTRVRRTQRALRVKRPGEARLDCTLSAILVPAGERRRRAKVWGADQGLGSAPSPFGSRGLKPAAPDLRRGLKSPVLISLRPSART